MGNTKEELIINNKQKNELESKFLKDIEMFVLYSCYKTNDLNSNDLLLNNKITEVFNKKNYIFNYNDYQNNNKTKFQIGRKMNKIDHLWKDTLFNNKNKIKRNENDPRL